MSKKIRERKGEKRELGREKERETEEMRSRIGALRDDTPTRHPDNAPGQDPDAVRGPPLNGSRFSEKNVCKFQMQVTSRKSRTSVQRLSRPRC